MAKNMNPHSASRRFSVSHKNHKEVDFFSLCERVAHDIEAVVKRGNLLNERQCRDLSSKLLQAVDNIRAIMKDVEIGPSELTFTPFLQLLYLSFEKAKLLVNQCAKEDWIAEAVFQVQNSKSFKEILQYIGMCYGSIYKNPMISNRANIQNLQSSSWCVPASASAIESDREDLRRRLKSLADSVNAPKEARKQSLARHLLQKMNCTSHKRPPNSSNVCNAGLWEHKMEPRGTWGNSKFLGSGSGASGVCRTQWLGVPCARKEFHGQASEVTFLKEASILSHLKHPRIVNFYCCGNGEAKGERFIAMELMEKSLFEVIEEQKGVRFALPVAVDIIFQIAEGMFYLHEQGVAHRDLKPQNVLVNKLTFPHLLDQYYCVKLVDFGMSKTKVEVSKSDIISCRGVGTTKYRAPEVHPKAHLDKANWFRVDVYSFAMTCAHVLSLKTPFEYMQPLSELYARISKGERPRLPSDVPRELGDILEACWDTDPLLRPSFKDICRWLHVLRLEELGGKSMITGYPTIFRDNIRYKDMTEYRTKMNGQFNKSS